MTDFLAETTDLLRRTPAVVAALFDGVPTAWTETPDVAGSYDMAVGPWKAYLGILLRRDDPAAVPG